MYAPGIISARGLVAIPSFHVNILGVTPSSKYGRPNGSCLKDSFITALEPQLFVAWVNVADIPNLNMSLIR